MMAHNRGQTGWGAVGLLSASEGGHTEFLAGTCICGTET